MDAPPEARIPVVLGPVTGARPPWGAPRRDLDAVGYVMEEYHLDGVTVAYAPVEGTSLGPDGRWDVEVVGEAGYRTRLLVVRPRDPARCNGTVVLHWQNVSAGYELGSADLDELFDGGFAWVGVSAQEIGLYGFPAGMVRGAAALARVPPLVEHDRERYGELRHPGDQGSFDIFTQAARAVGPARHQLLAGGPDPLGGLPVARVVAAGGSQSAMRLVAYANAVHPLEHAVDGFLLTVWEGRAPRPHEGAISFAGVRTTVRPDLDVPMVVVNSEFEATVMTSLPIRPVDTDRVRLWEVAGTPHGVARRGRTLAHGLEVNRLSYRPVHEAALRALQRWLVDGVAAPAQPRIEVDAATGQLRRDQHGNAVGGVRLPELEAPTAEHRGLWMGTGRAPLYGASRPFDEAQLRALYPTRAAFTARWEAAVDALAATGALRPEDAPAMKARAAEVALPVG